MDTTRMLEEMGEVPPADDAVIDDVIAMVLEAARREVTAAPAGAQTGAGHRPRRPLVLSAAALLATAAAVAVVVVLLPGPVGPPASPTGSATALSSGRHRPTVVTAALVRLISTQSAAATADAGTAVETTIDTTGAAVQPEPATTDVTFSGPNVNYLIVGNANGAAGVEDRVVDGRLYLYLKGPDLQMHWYHDTTPDAAASLTFPDPRTLLQAINPSAGLEDMGSVSVGGVELTRLQATNPAPVGKLGIPGVSGTVTAFDVWVDSADVVRQMSVSTAESGSDFVCSALDRGSLSAGSPPVTIPPADRVSTLPDGKPVPSGVACATAGSLGLGSTLRIQFAHLGQAQTITTPAGAIDQPGLG